jgi:ABC-type lipoprotein release transport system permease subunit
MAIEPEREPSGSGPLTIVRGRNVSAEPAGEVVIGRALADQLEVEPGGELVMLGQAVDGSTANARYTVVGVADAGSDELDATAVFLSLGDAQDFFGLSFGVHQILIRLPTAQENVSAHLEALRGALDLAELEGLSWDQMLPELKTVIDQKRQGQYGIAAVVFLIVALGVFNSMTMSTFERIREFGVMASLGTRPGRIRLLVVTEALLLGLCGLAIGLALAAGLIAAIGSIDMGTLTSGDMIGVRMPSVFTLRLHSKAVVNATVTVLLTVVAGGLWPAWRASRLKPVEATRYV